MHWRQREMLFEQREALKGNLEEKRTPEYTGFGDKSPKMRQPDSRVAAKSSKPRTGGGLQGPGKKKKRRSFEGAHEKDEGMHSKKEGMHSKKEGMHSKKEGMHSKKEGKHLKELSPMRPVKPDRRLRSKQDLRLKTSRSKKESHCEAYAEAYVRGVEAALRESRR
tara:strand:+ start:1617 stop:2111 length:495 start_codon:yes stop_codon:yes gene_type:complete